MATKSILIQCRVDSQEKEDWKEFAHLKLFPSISELIRYSVNKVVEENLRRDASWIIRSENKLFKNKFIRVRLSEKEKEKWDQYIEITNFPSVSELIRFSVYKIVDKEMKRYNNQISRLYLLYRNNAFYQNELNKFLELPPCKNCGLIGATWSEDGLCIDCYMEKKGDLNLNTQSINPKENLSLMYTNIKIPNSLINEINKNLESSNFLAYQSYTEFILDATRHRLEELKKLG